VHRININLSMGKYSQILFLIQKSSLTLFSNKKKNPTYYYLPKFSLVFYTKKNAEVTVVSVTRRGRRNYRQNINLAKMCPVMFDETD
jgi:hypothetical protein